MARAAKRPKRNAGQLSSDRILNSSSPIINKDLQSLFTKMISGWSKNYTEEEKKTIIDSLPPGYRVFEHKEDGSLKCPLSIEFVETDTHFKAAIARFKSDVQDGYYEKGWQTRASKATQDRQEGKFDQYLQEHADEAFKQQDDATED